MLLSPKKTIMYGPVNSRRLGRSLGVNILPAGQKTCSFNCVYCQYGWTDSQRIQEREALSWPSAKEVTQSLKEALMHLHLPPDYITFSGNGEPSLHPYFPDIVEAVTTARDQFAPGSQTAILSNSALVLDQNIRKSLAMLDRRIMKLDCGDRETFSKYNQPLHGIELKDLVCGLKNMEDITIQALFSAGESGNFTADNLAAWIKQMEDIQPGHVQIYSLDRDVPDENLTPVSRTELLQIKSLLKKAQISAEIY